MSLLIYLIEKLTEHKYFRFKAIYSWKGIIFIEKVIWYHKVWRDTIEHICSEMDSMSSGLISAFLRVNSVFFLATIAVYYKVIKHLETTAHTSLQSRNLCSLEVIPARRVPLVHGVTFQWQRLGKSHGQEKAEIWQVMFGKQ